MCVLPLWARSGAGTSDSPLAPQQKRRHSKPIQSVTGMTWHSDWQGWRASVTADTPATSGVMRTVKIDLPGCACEQASGRLRHGLVHADQTSALAREAPMFIALHELFDDTAEILEGYSSLLAKPSASPHWAAARSQSLDYRLDLAPGSSMSLRWPIDSLCSARRCVQRSSSPISQVMYTPPLSSVRSRVPSISNVG